MTTHETLARIVDDAGYIAGVEDDGVYFRCEGTRFWLETYADDPGYIRMMTSFVVPDGIEPERLLHSANDLNRRKKAVKTSVIPNDDESYVTFAIEVFNRDPEVWSGTFERSPDALRGASGEFFSLIRLVEA